ncbi:MAG: hypothetical protein DRJ35_07675 [Thermoprotei archaeon]|nr:MAG: hypothetical protein DRJ35_07675 [Thermoprotei archaeon]
MKVEDSVVDMAVLIAPALVSSIFTFVPIENILSEFIVPRTFVWYIPWRGAFVSFVLWLASGFLLSDEKRFLKMFFLGSAISFTAFHYWTLLVEIFNGYNIVIYPFFYTIEGSGILALDLGQIAILTTLFVFSKNIREFLAKRKKGENFT